MARLMGRRRLKQLEHSKGRKLTPIKAIREKCLDCHNNKPKEVRFCSDRVCPLYKYRLGRNPNRRGIGGSPFHRKLKKQV